MRPGGGLASLHLLANSGGGRGSDGGVGEGGGVMEEWGRRIDRGGLGVGEGKSICSE